MRASSLPAAALLVAAGLAAGAVPPAGAEIFVGSGNAILVFADDANGDSVPLRQISGLLTQLPSVFTLMLDRVHRELYVSGCGDSILVFSMDDVDEVAPRRLITGATTGLVSACSTVLDLVHDELFVVDSAGAVRVFPRLADGDQGPARTIAGAATGLASPVMGFLDLVHDELYVTNASGSAGIPRVRVFARLASDNATPVRSLGLAGSGINNPRGLLVDLEHDELIVVEIAQNKVHFYSRTASGADLWVREIFGLATLLANPYQVTLTENDELLIGNEGGLDANFVGHARTAEGDATPTRYVTALADNLSSPTGIASDRAKNCSEANSVDGCIFRDNFESSAVCYWTSAVGSPACP